MSPKPVILFACVQNSNRSQMAEAFARLHGGEWIEVHSAGSRPAGQVNLQAIRFMKEVGYDLSTHTSKSIDEFQGKEIDVVVTMGCGDTCPLVRARRRGRVANPRPERTAR
jgi:arsenate reductase